MSFESTPWMEMSIKVRSLVQVSSIRLRNEVLMRFIVLKPRSHSAVATGKTIAIASKCEQWTNEMLRSGLTSSVMTS